MFLSETDDFAAETVSQCLVNVSFPGYDRAAGECDRKRALRRKLCELLINQKSFAGSVERCVSLDETIPPFIFEEE